jgi:formylglycine-generating enzyme required for sulfatase activity
MRSSRKPKRPVVWFVGTLVVIAVVAGLADRANYWYRQQWHFVTSMQDLPPVDRSHWRQPPATWSNETVEIRAATPEGMKPIKVTYYINSIGMKLVRIEPGTFLMGLPDNLTNAVGPGSPVGGPMYLQHKVTLTKPYFIGAFEVTNGQFDMFDTQHKHRRPSYQKGAGADNHPVQPVTWHEAQLFCRWLSEQEGHLYGLSTEAQWEYACRAGTTTRTYWGDNVEDRTKANVGGLDGKNGHAGWSDDGYEYTAPVGSFPPNPWGLYDMIGNAREWVADWYSPFTSDPTVDPVGPPTGHCRANKGNGWMHPFHRVCSAYRDGDAPHDVKDIHGFRVACEAE